MRAEPGWPGAVQPMSDAVRAIDGSLLGQVKRPDSFGPASEMRWLPIASLRVDPLYQREISAKGRRNVRGIAEAFTWSRFGTVVVAPLNEGLFAIVDGQHRTTAAAALGITQVPCLIIAADAGEQAQAFRAINAATTRVHPAQLHKAALASGDREAGLVDALCRDAGVRVLTSCIAGSRMKALETLSVEALYRLARERRALALAVLRGVAAQAKDGNNLLRSVILDAVRLVLADHPAWWRDEARFLAALAEVDLDAEWRLAQAVKAKTKGLSAIDALVGRITTALLPALGKQPLSGDIRS